MAPRPSIRRATIALGCVAALLSLGVRPGAAQELVSFKLNGTDLYVRHKNSQAVLDKVGFNDGLARKDATFRMRFGLAGKCISLESLNFPGQYLRHQNFFLVLSKDDNTPLFKNDASFCTKNQLPLDAQTTFESVNKPGFFVRNFGGVLKIAPREDNPAFRTSTLFVRRPSVDTNRPDGVIMD
jgi:hypothetical protein